MKTTRTTMMTMFPIPGGGFCISAPALPVILRKLWSGRRAIRTTTGRALRVGRWSAPNPEEEEEDRGKSGSELHQRLSQWRTGRPLQAKGALIERIRERTRVPQDYERNQINVEDKQRTKEGKCRLQRLPRPLSTRTVPRAVRVLPM